MRRVTFQSVLAAASILWEGKSSPDVRTAAQLNVFLNRRATEFWERFAWPEWCPTERRFFGDIFDAEELISAGDVRYWPLTDAYYQVIGVMGGEPGTPGEPADADDETDTTQWALLPAVTDPEDWDVDTEYSQGDMVRHPQTLRRFQARQDMGAGIEPGTGSFWQDYWGEVFDFYRVIPFEQPGETPIGECFKVYAEDPRLVCNPCELGKDILQEGIRVRGSNNVVWLRFRERAPSWLGNPWSAETTYETSLNSQPSTLNQSWDSTTGDFYRSLQADNLNHAVTDTAYWERIEFPYVLRDAVPQAAYADMLRLDGQHEKFTGEAREAERLLRREFDKLERQSGQHGRLPVQTRD